MRGSGLEAQENWCNPFWKLSLAAICNLESAEGVLFPSPFSIVGQECHHYICSSASLLVHSPQMTLPLCFTWVRNSRLVCRLTKSPNGTAKKIKALINTSEHECRYKSYKMWQTEKAEAENKCGTLKPRSFLVQLVLHWLPPHRLVPAALERRKLGKAMRKQRASMEAGADFVQSGSCPRNKQKQWSKVTDGPRTLERVRYELHQYIYTTSLAASGVETRHIARAC